MNQTLENNSKEMATVVETFIIEETAELIYDGAKLDAWNKSIEELGLKGQGQIVKKDKSPIPFMPMKRGLENVLKTLCPRTQNIEEYDSSPIPLEILKLVSLSKKEGYFSCIQIWSDTEKPDPVCVGMTGYWSEMQYYGDSNKSLADKKYASQAEVKEAGGNQPRFNETQKYLIGKWADVKHSFAELRKLAHARFIEERETSLQKQIKTAQRDLDDLKLEADERFAI